MKIVIITGSLYNRNGGPYFSGRSLTKAFLLNGHEVVLIGSKDESSFPDTPEGYVSLKNEFHSLSIISMNKIGPYNLHFTPGLYRRLSEIKEIDLVYIQGVWMWNCWVAFLFSFVNSLKFVVSVRGEFNDKKSLSEPHKMVFMPLVRLMLNKATYVHVLNELERISLVQNRISNRVMVIPNGVFLNELTISKPLEKVVLYLGRLHPLKNVDSLIEAWGKINTSGWKLIIAGVGASEYELELQKKAEGQSNVSFYGHANESCLGSNVL
jgi:poly(glycerol-phosphate) alpha-glucosyltransferase